MTRTVLSLCFVAFALPWTAACGQPGASDDATKFKIKPALLEKIKAALPEKAPAKPMQPRKLLIFSKTNGFRHGSIPAGAAAITLMGQKTGAYTAVHSEDEAMFEPDKLKEFDAVLMLNTTGEVFRPKTLPKDPKEK